MKENVYKVLWVEDDTSLVDGEKKRAKRYNLELAHFSNWEEAYAELDQHFEEYSAIILDAYCQLKESQRPEEEFIGIVLQGMTGLFMKNQRYIPWYILSEGTMGNFNYVIGLALKSREGKDEEWGKMKYSKSAPSNKDDSSDKLFENIQNVAKKRGPNIVLYRYEEMFEYLGEGKLYGAEARKLMLRMLSALYYPEENLNFHYVGNDIRKVIESMFRAARKKGLLADECFDNRDKINLSDSSLYMAGKNTRHVGVRYGIAGTNTDGSGGDSVFPQDIAKIVYDLISVSSKGGALGSHTKEETGDMPYAKDNKYKDLFFGYVLQLCHVLNWFGEYEKDHSNIEENKKMKRPIPDSVVTIPNKIGIEELQENESKHQVTKTIPQDNENMSQEIDTTHQKQEEPELPKVSRDDVVGKEFIALNGIILSHTMDCKLSPDNKVNVKAGDKVRIVDVVENTEDDKDKFPFIATEVELLND